MTKHNLFGNVPATNGLARGYGPQPTTSVNVRDFGLLWSFCCLL